MNVIFDSSDQDIFFLETQLIGQKNFNWKKKPKILKILVAQVSFYPLHPYISKFTNSFF